MTVAAAREVSGWQYPPPFADSSFRADATPILLDPAERYHVVHDAAGEVVACFCLGESARLPGPSYGPEEPSRVDIGFARHPGHLASGTGTALLRYMLEFAAGAYGYSDFRATTSEDNHVACRILSRLGFVCERRFYAPVGHYLVHATREPLGN